MQRLIFRRPLQVLAALAALGAPIAVSQDRVIVFGGDAENTPFEYLDNGTARGFNVDLAAAIADHGRQAAEFVLLDWSEALAALESGAVDIVTMFHSEDREKQYHFTPPFHFINHYIYARRDTAAVSDVRSLAGSRVAVERASYPHARILQGDYGIDLILSGNALSVLADVEDDKADYAILSAPTADRLIESHRFEVARVSPGFWAMDFAFAVRQDNAELADWVTQQFYGIIRNGTYEEIYARWADQLDPDAVEEASARRRLVWIAIVAFVLLGVPLAWILRIRIGAYSDKLRSEAKARTDAEKKALWLSEHNVDSHLPRLQTFSEQVTRVLAATEPDDSVMQIVALKLADIDRIIHAHGHKARAKAIKDFTQWLTKCGFQLCGQDGRDVFFVFDTKEKIGKVFRRWSGDDTAIIRRESKRPACFAGAASWPMHAFNADDLLRRAETALSKAMKDHEHWVEYEPVMDNGSEDLHLISLFQATAAAGLYAVYQPQIDLKTRAIVGAEALVRWDAEGIGPVPPSRFIPLLEEAGLIRHVTLRMLSEAVRFSAMLRRNAIPCQVSVNVSISDLLSPKLPSRLQKMLDTSEGLPEDILLELTETSVTDNISAVKESIACLRDRGIFTCIDDFGTGFSSLSYLSGFSVKSVKIDQSFVAGMTSRLQDASIVRSTVAMAHELGLLVIAEGIETDEQMRMLVDLGCDRGQGYLISKPIRERQLAKLLRAHRNRSAE